MPCRIVIGLRVATYIHIGVHPLLIAFFAVGGEEDADCGLVVARVVVVQTAEGVAVLAGEAFAGGHATETARVVAQVAIGTVGLIASEGGAACGVADGGDDATERVGQEHVGRLGGQARQFPDQTSIHTLDLQERLPSLAILSLFSQK